MNNRRASLCTAAFSAMLLIIEAALMMIAPSAAGKTDPSIVAAVSAASIAEIEEVVEFGINLGNQIARGEIKLSTANVKRLVSGLTKVIRLKQASPPANRNDPNRTENKVDEISEVAAYVLGAISGAGSKTTKAELTSNPGKASKYAVAVIQAALKRTMKSAEFVRTDIVTDVVGSIALTIHTNPEYDAIEVRLQKSLLRSAKKIAGKANKELVTKALNTAFVGDPITSGFEYGNDLPVALIADPETDFRNN